MSSKAVENAVITALASRNLPAIEKLPTWITDRLASLDLNGGRIGDFFKLLAHDGGPRATAILKAGDKLADKLGLDDSLIDDLLADLKK